MHAMISLPILAKKQKDAIVSLKFWSDYWVTLHAEEAPCQLYHYPFTSITIS